MGRAKANVVMIKGHRKIAVANDAMNVLRMKMYEYDTQSLADTVGVSKSCIYAIQRGTTKWPRPNTFFGLLDALDLEMILRDRK